LKFLGKLGQGLGLGLDSISGYKDIKQLICRALHSEDSINILFWGEPASNMTMFLMELAKERGAVYFDCTLCMTHKDKMREGFVARTFHIPEDIDDELRMMAIKNHVRFSDEATLALRGHITKTKVGTTKK
jgi:hypothetical protein